jgi:hypothetical protein
MQIGKGKVKLSLFADDIYTSKTLKTPPKNLLDLVDILAK